MSRLHTQCDEILQKVQLSEAMFIEILFYNDAALKESEVLFEEQIS